MSTYPEPIWGDSEEAYAQDSAFVKKDILPMEITGALVRMLQYHFSDADNIVNTLLKEYLWVSDVTTSKIIIGPDFLRNDKVASKVPALYVQRGEVQFGSLGELRKITISSGGTSMNEPKYLRHAKGEHIVICEGMTGAEAEALGNEVFPRIMQFSPAIVADLEIEAFDVSGMGKCEQRKEQASATYVVPVKVTWQKTYMWAVREQEPY